MDPSEIEAEIEAEIPEASATVTHARGPDDPDHLAATVVSPAFEDRPLLEQHEMVYDALGELMTEEIHALELTTDVPEE